MKKTIFFIFLLISELSFSSVGRVSKSSSVKYRSSFGKCPARAVGSLTLSLIKTFEKTRSLRSLKVKIDQENLKEKHFLSNYHITFDPILKLVNFKYECPEPLMKVQIYKKNGVDTYDAILVENGKLYDPTYEVLLRSEKKLTKTLPFLGLPVGNIDEKQQKTISSLINRMKDSFRPKLSELIINEKGELTIILSVKGRPSSVFMGNDIWNDKLSKLERLVSYMEKKGKIPAIINLTNAKKVVVKFNDKF